MKLWINNQEVEAEPHQTILEAADRAGIYVPRLCHHPSLKPNGACRLCAVEMEGCRGLPAACSTPVAPDMKVRTDTPQVVGFRREMLRLILQDHPRECLGCPRNGTCELQQLVEAVGIEFPYFPKTVERPPVQSAGAYFERDMGLCVRCGRCVRICHEVRGAKAIVFREVEGRREVGTPLRRSLEEAGCQFCGACVDVCPVGALRERPDAAQDDARQQMLRVCEGLTGIVMDLYREQTPHQWKSSICPICTAGCRMSFELTESGEIIQARPEADELGNGGQACVQGRFLLKGYVQRPERLRRPLVLENGRYREADWETVLGFLGKKFQSYGPWETAVLADTRLTLEELYLLRKFARTLLGTNLVGCITPSGHAAAEELLSKRSNPAALRAGLGDLSRAGAVLAIGANPSAGHPIAGTYLREAVLNGTKLIVASPLSVDITRYADVNLHHTPGTESVLLAGIIRLLLDGKRENPDLAARNPSCIHTLKQNLAGYHPEAVAGITGVSPENLMEAACLMGGEKPLTILYGLGLAGSPDVRESMNAMIMLLTLTGSISKAGGGMVPLYGSVNLHGASDLGMISRAFEAPMLGSGPCGAATGDIYEMLASGQIKALYLAFEGMESSLLDSLRPFLHRVELVVLHDMVLPPSTRRETAPVAHVVLPMASALEKGGTFRSFERKDITMTSVVQPPGEARSVLDVIRGLARSMKAPGFARVNEEALRDEIRKQIAAGATPARNSLKAASGCSCCRRSIWAKGSSDCGDDIPEWEPAPLESFGDSRDSRDGEFPCTVVCKEDLAPYFLGPLLAEESKAVFYPAGEIGMNPSEASRVGFVSGDAVRIVTPAGDREGRLGLNALLPSKVVAVPMALFSPLAMKCREAGRSVAGRVEKGGE